MPKKKEKAPAFQFYPADWLSSARTRMMTGDQVKAYINLLCYDWLQDGIEDNDAVLAVLSDVREAWNSGCAQVVKSCFNEHPKKPGWITNLRLQKRTKKTVRIQQVAKQKRKW